MNTTTNPPFVAIPEEVYGNSRDIHRATWRSDERITPEQLAEDMRYALDPFGYRIETTHLLTAEGEPVTQVKIVNPANGHPVETYLIEYYSRVKCTDCEHSWAQVYLRVTDADGVTHPAAPFCGTHADHVRKVTARWPGYSLAESQPLRVGQH